MEGKGRKKREGGGGDNSFFIPCMRDFLFLHSCFFPSLSLSFSFCMVRLSLPLISFYFTSRWRQLLHLSPSLSLFLSLPHLAIPSIPPPFSLLFSHLLNNYLFPIFYFPFHATSPSLILSPFPISPILISYPSLLLHFTFPTHPFPLSTFKTRYNQPFPN